MTYMCSSNHTQNWTSIQYWQAIFYRLCHNPNFAHIIPDLMITVGHRTFSEQIASMSCHSLDYPDTFSVQSTQYSIAQFKHLYLTSILFTGLGCTVVAVTVSTMVLEAALGGPSIHQLHRPQWFSSCTSAAHLLIVVYTCIYCSIRQHTLLQYWYIIHVHVVGWKRIQNN